MSNQIPGSEPVSSQLPPEEVIMASGHQNLAGDLGDVAIQAEGADPSIVAAKKILKEELNKPPTHGALWG